MAYKSYCRFPVFQCGESGGPIASATEQAMRAQTRHEPLRSVWGLVREYYDKFSNQTFMQDLHPQTKLALFRGALANQSGKFCVRPRMCIRAQMTCCGQCTYPCMTRCGLDVSSRLQMYLSEAPQETVLYRTVAEALSSEETTYEQYCALVNQIVSGYYNASKRKELRLNGISDNPNKYTYAPRAQYEISPKTGKPRTVADPRTGQVALVEWPGSGLCPYCLPVVSARHRVIKPHPEVQD